MKKKIGVVFYNLFVSIITLLLIELFEWREFYEFMLLYSINAAIVYFLLLYREISNFKGMNLGILLLIGFIMRLVLPSITKSFAILEGEKFSFVLPENEVNDYLFPTIVWMNIYYMIFYWCVIKWSFQVSIESEIRPFFMRHKITFITIPFFVIGLLYIILTSYIPAGIIPSFIHTMMSQLATLIIIVQLFNTVFNPSKLNRSLFTLYILSAAWTSLIFGFSKGVIMMNFLFYLLYYFLNCKYQQKPFLNAKFVMFLLVFFILIDLVVYPFMSTKRIVSGYDPSAGAIATVEYSNMDILKDVLRGKIEKDDNNAVGRLDATTPNAFYYKECCKKNLRTSVLAIDMLEMLVPRFLYPQKHDSRAGMMAYSFATTGSFFSETQTVNYVYIGQFASSYLIGGPIAVFVLALLNGWFLSKYYNFLLRHIKNILALLLFLPFMMIAVMGCEEIVDGGVFRIGYYSIMMFVVYTITRFFPKFLSFNFSKK